MSWEHPTLHHEMTRRWRAKNDLDPVPNRTVRCGVCRRQHIPLDMMTDLRTLTPQLRSLLPHIPLNETFACDGCISTVYREGMVSPLELGQALGADEDALQKLEEYTMTLPVREGSRAHRHQQSIHRRREAHATDES